MKANDNMVTIRPFNPTDEEYAAVVAIHNVVWPDGRQDSAANWRANDEEWPTTALNRRFVVEYDGRIIGVGTCLEKYWQHQPGTVHLDFHVHPDHATGEALSLLYDHLIDFLRRRIPQPEVIATRTREDRAARVQFLLDRGFQSKMRFPRGTLSVADFAGTRFHGLYAKIAAQGIHIYTLSELFVYEPDWKQKLYELRSTINQDVPTVEPPTRITLAEFETMFLDDPAFDPAAWFIAVNESTNTAGAIGRFVGMSNLWVNDTTFQRLDTGLTGVISSYRRRGIATALKMRTIEFAQQRGALTIETKNEENNPMYAMNLTLGFQPKAAWVSYRKPFTDDA